jgi:hypothetical protein
MKKFYSIILLAILFTASVEPIFSQIRCPRGSVSVRGHRTKKGRIVKPHCRTRRDGNKRNNWSTKGNRNPVTRKRGWIRY